MRRYYALTLKTLDMDWVPQNGHEPYGRYEVVLADEAEAEIRRWRAALDLEIQRKNELFKENRRLRIREDNAILQATPEQEENKILRKGLSDIISHMHIIAGDAADKSTIVTIARAVLKEDR